MLIGHATEVDMDAQGRLLLSPVLREHAMIDKSMVIVGQGKKFEIWSKDHWEKQCDQWLNQENGGSDESSALEGYLYDRSPRNSSVNESIDALLKKDGIYLGELSVRRPRKAFK